MHLTAIRNVPVATSTLDLEREIISLAKQLFTTGKVANKILILTQSLLQSHARKFTSLSAEAQEAVIISHAILGNFSEVVWLYEQLGQVMEDPTILSSSPQYHKALLKAHLKTHKLRTSQRLIARIPQQNLDPESISLLISALMTTKDCASALRVARRYKTSHGKHSIRTRAYLMMGLKTWMPRGYMTDMEEVEAWFGGVPVVGGTVESLEYLQYCVGALSDLGQVREARGVLEELVRVWKAMAGRLSDEDSERVVVAYSSLMRGEINRVKVAGGNVNGSEAVLAVTNLFEELRGLGLQPNLYCYTPLMWGYYKYAGLEKLVTCHEDMLRDGVEPDQGIYNILIRAYTLEKLTQNAIDLFNEMVHVRGLYPNVRVLTSVMATLSLIGDMDACVKLFSQIEASGMKADHTLFHVVMSGYAQQCDVASVLTWYNHLLSAGLKPDVVTYTVVMYAISRSTDPEATRRWYDRIFSSSVLPNVYTYSLLIHDRAKRGDLVAGIQIYKDLVRTGVKPTAATFTTLINSHMTHHRNTSISSENFQEAVELCHEMMTDAVRPDVAVFHVIMKLFSSMGKVEESVAIFERLKASGSSEGFGMMVEPDETMYMTAILGYATLENLPKVEETLRDMLRRGEILGVKKYPPVMVLQTVLKRLSQMLWKRDPNTETKVVELFERIFLEFLSVGATSPKPVTPTPELFEKLIRITARNLNTGLSVMLYREMVTRGFSSYLEPVTRDILFKSLSVGNNLNRMLDAVGASVVAGTSMDDSIYLNQALEVQREQKQLTSLEQVDSALIRLEESIRFCSPPSSTSSSLLPLFQRIPLTKENKKGKLPSRTVHILLESFNGSPMDLSLLSKVWKRIVELSCFEISKSVLLIYTELLSRLGRWDEILDVMTVQCKKGGWMVEGLIDEVCKIMRKYVTASETVHEKAIVEFWKINEHEAMNGSKETITDSLPKRVKQLEFGVFSAQDSKKLSVIELHEPNLFDLSKPGRPPARFGVLDRRMGVADKVEKCETCGLGLQDCVGHFGVVRLALPVFHIGYFKLMITVLQNICKNCSKVLLEEAPKRTLLRRLRRPDLDSLQKKDILKSLNTACKKVSKCPHCESLNGTVKKVGALKVIHEKFKKKKGEEEAEFRASFDTAVEMDPTLKAHIGKAQEDLSPLTVLRLLERISDQDCELLGLDPINGRPELFIWTALPVPPVCIRPSIGQEDASNEDDITVLVSEVIKINAIMRAILADGYPAASLMEHWDYLQLQCAMFVTSDLPGIPSHLQSNLQKIKKGFCQRLKGKHGRFRGNLSGKRVDFSGRTVIGPDPNLRIDQVAVPQRIAMVLTYPERVTDYNIERLKENVINGTEKHPGATYITLANGIKRFLKYGDRKKLANELRVGDLVQRHLQDDDIVLFNRQPSLHKLSIMSHYAKIRPWRTLRFNECVCQPYNADFDGDEMNLHVPQTEEARAEAQELMGVKNNLVTPRNGDPLIAATQDFLTASYLQSRKDVFYDRSQFSQICNYMFDALLDVELPPPTILKPMKLWTGKQVFTVLLKPNKRMAISVNLETKCRTFEKPKSIPNSIHPAQLDPSMCPNDGYLVILNSEIMAGVVDKSIIGAENKKSLFYTVLRDFGAVASANCMNRVAKLSARWLANQGFSIGIDDVQPGEVLRREKESLIVGGYATCDDLIQQKAEGRLACAPGMNEDQTLEREISRILSGLRDSVGNICMTELNKYNAPLIMSLCGSKGSKINVSQMVALVGQQIISGSRIPDGFIDRSLPHFPKNSKIPPAKGFVRNSFYSGLAPPEFLFHAVSGREGLVDTAVKTAETGYMQRRLMKALEDLTTHYDLSVRNSTGGVIQFTYGDDGLDPAKIESSVQPVEFPRNLLHAMSTYLDLNEAPLLPYQILDIFKKEKTVKFKHCSSEYVAALERFIDEELVSKQAALRRGLGYEEALEPSRTAGAQKLKNRITRRQFDMFLEICQTKYRKARIEPGTAVGAVGAQSIGEPGTQMTLKTFHFAGVASMNVTLGVPRIKEIINASKTINTPIIKGHLVEKTKADKRAARVVQGRIERTTLESISEYIEEIISPTDCCLRIKIDMESIGKAQLEISLETIAIAIVKTSKLKLTETQIHIDRPDAIIIKVNDMGKGDTSEMFQTLQAIKRAVPKVVVKGLSTVNRAVIVPVGNEFQVHVEGYGLREIMGTEGIDGVNTQSNHILENWKTLGIEAGRKTIINEIVSVMQSHGMTIDQRHVMLLADLMTFKGEILGITRFGIAKMKDSVLMLASFEKTTDHLFEASFFGKKDAINGVSECIIMGVPMGIGTGLFKLLSKVNRPEDVIPPAKQLMFDQY
ncbi:hypothetical protein HDU99_007311 [Rhizoclosmatium hyalinum]|nr:hypothetical protein HDU99_007311 [Rhizoclosmatium hyalinum]